MASEMIKVQQLANKSAKQIQSMINKANKVTLNFNAQEAKKTRDFNKAEASTAREFNALEAEKARAFEKEMSDTSHQREVADLRAAGLNPVLSINNGATSYTGASASASPASGQNASAAAESGASAMSNILGTMMNSMVGLRSTQLQTEANLRAAQIQASATKYASDNAYKAAIYSADKSYQAVIDQPRNTIPGIVDKYLTQAGFKGNTIKEIASNVIDIAKDPKKYFGNNGNISKNNIPTTRIGWNLASKYLNKNNIPVNQSNVKMWYQAVLFGDSDAIKYFRNWNNSYHGHAR